MSNRFSFTNCGFHRSLGKPGEMVKGWVSSRNLARMFYGSEGFWRENVNGGWATILALIIVLIWQVSRFLARRFRFVVAGESKTRVSHSGSSHQFRIFEIISDADLKILINNLDGELDGNEKWDNVVDKRNNLLSYNAKSCKPKDGPLKYLSVTVFESCSTELLRDFYLDNEYRKLWDKMLVDHKQLQVDETNGIEIGRTIKKFLLLTPREYVLTWRVWEGKDKSFYCFIKECEHPLAPPQKKYVRVGLFRSGWRIRKVPGRNACEIKMVHQEDAGLNVEMAKLAFSKGIWSYVCKMESALRKYSSIRSSLPSSTTTAVTLVQKVPPELDSISSTINPSHPIHGQVGGEVEARKLSRRPSKKWIANGLLLLGGVICLSRGHSNLGAKITMLCILKKLTKYGASSSQSSSSSQTGQS